VGDLLIFALVGILLPTVALIAVASLFLLAAAALRRAPFQTLSVMPALFAAFRLQVVFVIGAGVVLALLFGRALVYGFPALVAVLTVPVGVIGFVVFASRGIPAWLTWPAWRRVLSWPFRAE
jgi:hypothetical protein